MIGLLAVLLAVLLRWYWRRARGDGEQCAQQRTEQHGRALTTPDRMSSHPESLTRATAPATAYGTIERVTPMPAPMTSPGAGGPFAEAGQPGPAPSNPELADAVAVARAAAEQEAQPVGEPIGSSGRTSGADADAAVGAHAGTEPEGPDAVTHFFESHYPGYVGWRWAVTVASSGPGAEITVSEVVLLPGPDALTAPQWVPWSDRVRPEDMSAGDLLPAADDDHRLVPGYLAGSDEQEQEVAWELGFGRERVLSFEGKLEAADRWFGGDFGPGSEMARMAPAACSTCGFFLQLAGSMGGEFGVCANGVSPADGRVVSVEFGCGAHSQTEVDTSSTVPVAEVVYDDTTLDFETRG
nr:DUF3027 domain-containing protein [Saccharopolyspora sp. HNM0983]